MKNSCVTIVYQEPSKHGNREPRVKDPVNVKPRSVMSQTKNNSSEDKSGDAADSEAHLTHIFS